MGQEIELKLALGKEGPERLCRHPRLAGASCERRHLVNTYYDTPDGRLEAARMALRLRRRDASLRQTLKTEGDSSGGLSRRDEWEWEVPGPGLDHEGLAALPSIAALGPAVLGRLEARFTTDFTRRAWTLTLDGASVEVALDEGEIRSGARRAAIRELELELKAGSPAVLRRLAAEFADSVPLRPAETSKAARGSALLAGHWSLPAGDGTPAAALRRAMCALDALADSGDDAWRRTAIDTLADLAEPEAAELAARLKAADWLTPAFGQLALHLAQRLDDAAGPGERQA